MKQQLITIAAVLCLALPLTAAAEEERKTKYSDDELIQILKDEGYRSIKKTDPGELQIKIGGKDLYFLNLADGSLQAYYGISGAAIRCEDINTWNRTKRLSHAYLDEEGDPMIEANLIANGGISKKNITEFFGIFTESVDLFRQFIFAHSGRK